jgi:hypothetical protein
MSPLHSIDEFKGQTAGGLLMAGCAGKQQGSASTIPTSLKDLSLSSEMNMTTYRYFHVDAAV